MAVADNAMAARAFLLYNKEEINQLCQWATMKMKVACFHKMGTHMGMKWAVFFKIRRKLQY
ncbi:hypothetical protein PS396_00950 [Limosilactobacillus pontis]|uniref:Uncharacterized protein n=1 Tax=Limosilactobacillus pontis TaxID=35787 RepID=A0ABU7SQN9_9LACO